MYLLLLLLTQCTANSLLETMIQRRAKTSPVIIMPVFLRKENYLDDALISVNKARGDMPVLLVTATPGYAQNATGWCSYFECIETPPIPQDIYDKVIAMDTRGDDNHFLKWRTKEAWDAMFAMRQFVKTGRQYMIWMQDDVYVHDLDNIPDHDITCLRTGHEYCGMVAYKIKRWVVIEFIRRIERDFLTKPIDWILDELRGDLKLQLHRVPKADHKGKKSSNNKIRNVDS